MKKIFTRFLKQHATYTIIGMLLLSVPQYATAQVVLNESFDNSATFPPTGWTSNVLNAPSSSSNVTSFDWQWQPSGGGAFPYPNTHTGAGMANYNSYWIANGGSAELITPVLDFSTPGYDVLSFWMYRSGGSDYLEVYLNTAPSSSGPNAQLLGTINNATYLSPTVSSNGWYQYTYTLQHTAPYNTATNYVIFRSVSAYGDDINIDDVNVNYIAPCTGVPSGSMTTAMPCAYNNFTLYYTDSLHSLLTYQWQYSTDSVTWTNTGSNQPSLTTSISSDTYFRVIVNCTASGMADTFGHLIHLAPFYACYCDVTISGYSDANIGNVNIKSVHANTAALDNGVAYPTTNNPTAVNNYSNFDTLSPMPVLYRDSTYKFTVTQIARPGSSWNESAVSAYIDFNHNGIYEPSELVLNNYIGPDSMPRVADTFHVSDTAYTGITGMRVLLDPNGVTPLEPCTAIYYGEVEDYFINISYDPCDGPTEPGVAHISDTNMCPGIGYAFTLTDTTHAINLLNTAYVWQMSPDNGVTWGPVPNTANRDTVTLAYDYPAWYRMRMICNNTHDTTYSNIVKIHSDPGYACYCYSMATGGHANDSDDIGAFGIGRYTFLTDNGVNNSHIYNPTATRPRTDYTPYIMDLSIDSTYLVSFYQTMHRTHSDGKITMFIDYNNNLVYDVPDERVLTLYTNNTDFYLTDSVTIPHNIITGVPTGMRIIINDNTGANVPSDDGCGGYTSGETEDYVVVFHDASTASVGSIAGLNDLSIYPNPTDGKFGVQFTSTQQINNLQISVMNITGQKILVRDYNNITNSFSTNLDLTGQPDGVYFIEFSANGQKMIRKLVLN